MADYRSCLFPVVHGDDLEEEIMGFDMRPTPFCINPLKRLNPMYEITPQGMMDKQYRDNEDRRRRERMKKMRRDTNESR